LTEKVENFILCFPSEVVKDLSVTAEGDDVASWALGLGKSLRPFKAGIEFNRPLMALAKRCGFDSGFEVISGKEPSIAHVGRLACQYQSEERAFSIASEDTGEGPLSPTMEQLCDTAPWARIDAREAIIQLGFSNLLV